MRILVTGAQGQLARSLVERGAGRDDIEVIALGRPELDLAVPGRAAAVVESVGPGLLINCAAYTAVDQAEDDVEAAFRINADAAGEIAAAAAQIAAPVFQISTDYVFDGRASAPYDEESRPNPLGVYGRSKLAGEEQVRAANPRHLILRTAWVYSPFGRNFVKTMMNAARDRDMLTVVDDQRGSPTSALDLADALLLAAGRWSEPLAGGTYHLAGAGETSWFGFAEAIMAECRKRGLPAAGVRPIRTADWPTRAPRPAYSVLDSRKFARDFDYEMPPWQESLAAVIDRLARAGG